MLLLLWLLFQSLAVPFCRAVVQCVPRNNRFTFMENSSSTGKIWVYLWAENTFTLLLLVSTCCCQLKLLLYESQLFMGPNLPLHASNKYWTTMLSSPFNDGTNHPQGKARQGEVKIGGRIRFDPTTRKERGK